MVGFIARRPGAVEALTTLDGGYYLSLARDLAEGTSDATTALRAQPDGLVDGRNIPSLLSLLAAPLPFAVTAGWLIPLLGSLIAVPVFLLARRLDLRLLPAAFAALLASLGPMFLARSSAGWVDTDALQPVFATGLVAAGVFFATAKTRRRHIAAALAFLALLIGWWLWWDQAPDVVFGFAALTAVGVLPSLAGRLSNRQWLLIGLAAFLAAAVLIPVANRVLLRVYHIGGIETDWPQVGQSITELQTGSWIDKGRWVAGHLALLPIGLLGAALLFLRSRAWPLLGLALLGIAALWLGQRFLVFLIPVWALGIARLTNLHRWGWIAGVLPLALLLWSALTPETRPKLPLKPTPGHRALAAHTEADALIWTWWDSGYPIQLHARRATLADGGYHDSQITHCLALPLVQSHPALAAAWMRFFAVRGRAGVNECVFLTKSIPDGMTVLRAGIAGDFAPAQALDPTRNWPAFFHPDCPRPLYLLLDDTLARTLPTWFETGTWDPAARAGFQVGTRYHPYTNLRWANGQLTGDPNLRLPLPETATRRIAIFRGSQIGLPDDRQLELNLPAGRAALVPPAVANSLYHQLWLRQESLAPHFTLVPTPNAPGISLYQVAPRAAQIGNP